MGAKIICKGCGKVLQQGSGEPEYKYCIKCVVKDTPGSPSDRLTLPEGVRKEKKMKPPQVDLSMDARQEEDGTYKALLILEFQTYEKKKLGMIDFTIDQLEGFLEDMRQVEEDLNVKKDEK